MNSLDSRQIGHGDTFAQKFSRPGRYNYDFGLPGIGELERGGRFTITVNEALAEREPQQHYVSVRHAKNEKRLEALPRELTIEQFDIVLWSPLESSVPGFSIIGSGEGDAFNSAALTHEAVYTHAFGSAGVFVWQDANGHRLGGTITVAPAETKTPADLEQYRSRLAEGKLVEISGGKVSPAEVNVIVGQTVFFAVEKADGITITDVRLKVAAVPLVDQDRLDPSPEDNRREDGRPA